MDIKNIAIDGLQALESGVISGYASVFNIVDQHNDLIKHGAFKKLIKNKVKLLWQHKAEEPIGIIKDIYEDSHGLFFRAQLLLDLPQAKAAYELLKSGAISGVSIGYKAIKFHHKSQLRIIESIELWEISLVTFPANSEANIIEIKQQNKGAIMQQVNTSHQKHQKAWEDFKAVNEQIETTLEQKGFADPLLNEQLQRINNYLDHNKSRIDNLETSLSRPFNSFTSKNNFGDVEHKQAFSSYLRSGNEGNLSKIELKTLSVSSEPDGGYLITRETSKQISQILEEISPFRQLAAREQISSSSLDVIEDYENAQAGWTNEMKLVEDTDTPKVNKRNIPVFELYAQPTATQKLIDDAAIDIEKWLADKLVNSFAKLENKAFIGGDGINCPRGILTYPDGKTWGKIEQIKTGAEASFTADNLFSLYYALKSQYCQNASFLMNRITLHSVRTLKDKNTGRYIWNPSLSDKAPDTLLGLPVFEAADMPNSEKGSLSIALADFKSAYKIVDRAGIRVMRDPYTFKPFVKFYTTKRVGGDVINFEAIKLLNLS